MKFKEHIKLAPFTTFKIGGEARFFCVVKNQFDAQEAFNFAKEKNLETFVLGGGSNLVVSDNGFKGLVMKVEGSGIEIVSENETEVLLKVSAGENWDKVVEFTVKNSWWGLENLSHIPGSTGAIAVQNVGAYGQEAKNIIKSVGVYDTQNHTINVIDGQDCEFEYRKSIFNSTEKGRYIIFDVTFKLSKTPRPILNYRDLQNKFSQATPTLNEIRQTVIEIRDKKFPFPNSAKKGNAGSFFKNPFLNFKEYATLKTTIASVFGEEKAVALEAKKFLEKDQIKIPAAFLLDICGLKNLELGGASINQNQPLVIVNSSGGAKAKSVLELASKVLQKIHSQTGILLKIEPELLGFSEKELKVLNVV